MAKGPESRANIMLRLAVASGLTISGAVAGFGFKGLVDAPRTAEASLQPKPVSTENLLKPQETPIVTIQIEGAPRNEDILLDPEALKLYEQYVIDEHFTEITPSRELYGPDGQIATWGMESPGAPGGASVSYYTETFALAGPQEGISRDGRPQPINELADISHQLPIGESRVIPYKNGPRFEPYGTVIVPRKDVRVFVRTWGNVPAEYSLIPSELVVGSTFDGYYLNFNSYARVSENAEDQGIESIDGTPFQPTKEYTKYRGSYYFTGDIIPAINPEIVVLPNNPSAETAAK